MKIITMLEFRKNTAQVIRWSQKGLRMTVTYRGTPVMKIEPILPQRKNAADPFYDLCGIAEQNGGSLSNEAMDKLIYEL